jgi:opacity protein-like surface antigen
MLLNQKIISIITTAGACLVSMQLSAGVMGDANTVSPWAVSGSIGYTNYENMYANDGGTPIARLAIGRDLLKSHSIRWGLELGYQNGNSMRLNVPQATLDILGGLPIQTTTKSMLDLLATAQFPLTKLPFFALVKGGIAYRHWEFNDRSSISNQSKIAGTVQAGFGYQISERSALNLLYQGIYGGNPNLNVYPVTLTASVSNIPIQNGVLLGITYSL